jgi:3D (Asp-Asp-Asp) domain-containing protein
MKNLFQFIIFVFFVFLGVAQKELDSFSLLPPEKSDSLVKLHLWATQYFIHQFNSSGKIPIVFEDGEDRRLFADTCDFCTAALEGTAYVKDSIGNIIVINFASRGDSNWVDCRKCKKFTQSKLNVESWGKTVWDVSSDFGNGVQNYKLIPFRTIAVDPKMIPFGSVIYIPLAKGDSIQMPSGDVFVHDGYFFAGDTGGAIKENHIDVFTGVFESNPFSNFLFSNSSKSFEAYVVSDEKINEFFIYLSGK